MTGFAFSNESYGLQELPIHWQTQFSITFLGYTVNLIVKTNTQTNPLLKVFRGTLCNNSLTENENHSYPGGKKITSWKNKQNPIQSLKKDINDFIIIIKQTQKRHQFNNVLEEDCNFLCGAYSKITHMVLNYFVQEINFVQRLLHPAT